MSIIIQNQTVRANVQFWNGHLELEFPEDPSHALAETVFVDLPQRSIGIIVANTYHHVGHLPQDIDIKQINTMTRARLFARGEAGRVIELFAPIQVVSH